MSGSLAGQLFSQTGVGIVDVALYSNDFGLLIFGALYLLQGAVHGACAQCAPESFFGGRLSACSVSMGTAWQKA